MFWYFKRHFSDIQTPFLSSARVGIGNAFSHVDVPDFFVNINSCFWYIVSKPPEQKFDHLLFFTTLAVNGI